MPTGVWVFGPFRFDRGNSSLSRDGVDVHLTPRVADVLCCLVNARGAVVSKDQLFDDVWKGVSVTDDALLQVVSVLRKALGDNPRRPEYIQTITGEGYRFIADVRDEAPIPAAPTALDAHAVPATPRALAARPVIAASRSAADEADAATSPVSSRLHPWRWQLSAAATLLAVFFAWGLWSGVFARLSPSATVDERTSIAVLPFLNIGEPGNEHFSDGLAEELLVRLGRVEGLRVVARTSSFSFRNASLDVAQIGSALNADAILEGSARSDGERVRIVARLVDPVDGFELWSNDYDVPYDDVLSVPGEIARQVVDALTIPLLGESAVLLMRSPTSSAAAWELYSKGTWLLARYTVDSYQAAARYFEDALEIDPEFALAHVGRADAYLLQSHYGALSQHEALAVAAPAIDEALRIDSELAYAHAMMGLVHQRLGDIDAARRAYERAIDLDPELARAYQLYWWMMFILEGNTADNLALAEKALAADPYSPAQNENYGWTLFEAGRFDEALGYFQKSIDLEPDYPFGHNGVGAYHQVMGNTEEAIAAFEQAMSRSPDTHTFRSNLGRAYAIVGRADEAIAQAEAMINNRPQEGGWYADIGDVYWSVLGRPDQAAGWYQQAIDRNPSVERLRLNMGLLCLDLNDVACAERWVASAEEIDADHHWSKVGKMNLDMHAGNFPERASDARAFAAGARYRGHLSQYDHPYADYEPLGYFSLLAGRPADAPVFPTRAYPELMDDDPVINALNINAALDLAATLQHSGDRGRADVLLRRSEDFIDRQTDAARQSRYREERAEIFALRGMVPEALAAFREAIDNGWRKGWWRARHKPHYAALRDEPQFQAMLRELEADADRMRRSLAASLEGR